MDEDLIKRLKKDSDFTKFQEWALSIIDGLNSIDDLKNMSIKKAGETVRVRAIAASKLQEILTPFLDFKEKSEPSTKAVQAAKDRVGL